MSRLGSRLRSQRDNLRLLLGITRTAYLAHRTYGIAFKQALSRGLLLVRSHRFEPEEAYHWGLMDPALREAELAGFVSKRAMSAVQNRLNPRSFYYVTEDKGIFYRVCSAQGIPIPKIYGITFRDHPGWSPDGRMPDGVADWESILTRVDPPGIVVKPCRSLFGRGVQVYSMDGDAFVSPDNARYSARAVAESICQQKQYDSLVAQERLTNHSAFGALGATEFLQTVRILTYADQSGKGQLLAAFLKVIRGNNVTDNFEHGQSGNIILRLNTTTGAPEEVLIGNRADSTVSREGWCAYCKRDDTVSADFTVPDWPAVTHLANRIAPAFLPLRLVGWDLALTDGGLRVLEANFRADPYPSAKLRELLRPAFQCT